MVHIPQERDSTSIGCMMPILGFTRSQGSPPLRKRIPKREHGTASLPYLGDEMNPKRVYGSYTLIGILVVEGI